MTAPLFCVFWVFYVSDMEKCNWGNTRNIKLKCNIICTLVKGGDPDEKNTHFGTYRIDGR